MKRRIAVVGLAAVFVPLLAGCGIFREVAEPSEPIEAIPLEIEGEEIEPTEAETTAVTIPTEEAIEEPATPTEIPVEEPTSEPEEEAQNSGELAIFQISQDASQVRFELDEDLRGSRITVVGETNQIAGEMALNFDDLASTQIGVIQINARALTTDNDFRNRAINNEILQTGSYEFITFTPTAIEGLPDTVAVGESVTFSVIGDLTIREITNEVVFEIVATAVADDQISGTASTVIDRTTYDLNIPSVPNVANVEEEVELYIDFLAIAAP